MNFPKLNQEIADKWVTAADRMGVPQENYPTDIKIVSSPDSDFTFGVILNERRALRPQDTTQTKINCPLCRTVNEIQDKATNISNSQIHDYVVIPNLFPVMGGHSLAVTSGMEEKEVPMYTTKNLSRFPEQMNKIFRYCSEKGFQAFQNGPGAGASIPNHEHTHLTNWEVAFSQAGVLYGFESATLESTSVGSVKRMQGFPFEHLVFPISDVERIQSFLQKFHFTYAEKYSQGFIPHILCQGQQGILVAPFKKYVDRGSIGSGDVAGHIGFKERSEFDAATYQKCLQKLSHQMFGQGEVNLERFL